MFGHKSPDDRNPEDQAKTKPKATFARKVLKTGFGPITMIKQSIGTNLGKSVFEQHRIWKETSYVDMEEILAKRGSYDLEKACLRSGKTEKDVRKAYRNVQITQSALWLFVIACGAQLIGSDNSMSSSFLLVVGLLASMTAVLATVHHQVSIREKMFFSPVELFGFLAANPSALLPFPIPANWKLFTKGIKEGAGRESADQPKPLKRQKKMVVRKRSEPRE
jgi:hypothetical protein